MTIEEKINDIINSYNETVAKINSVGKILPVTISELKLIEEWTWVYNSSPPSDQIIDKYLKRKDKDNEPDILEMLIIKVDYLITNTSPSECLTSPSEYIRRYKECRINEQKKSKTFLSSKWLKRLRDRLT